MPRTKLGKKLKSDLNELRWKQVFDWEKDYIKPHRIQTTFAEVDLDKMVILLYKHSKYVDNNTEIPDNIKEINTIVDNFDLLTAWNTELTPYKTITITTGIDAQRYLISSLLPIFVYGHLPTEYPFSSWSTVIANQNIASNKKSPTARSVYGKDKFFHIHTFPYLDLYIFKYKIPKPPLPNSHILIVKPDHTVIFAKNFSKWINFRDTVTYRGAQLFERILDMTEDLYSVIYSRLLLTQIKLNERDMFKLIDLLVNIKWLEIKNEFIYKIYTLSHQNFVRIIPLRSNTKMFVTPIPPQQSPTIIIADGPLVAEYYILKYDKKFVHIFEPYKDNTLLFITTSKTLYGIPIKHETKRTKYLRMLGDSIKWLITTGGEFQKVDRNYNSTYKELFQRTANPFYWLIDSYRSLSISKGYDRIKR